ncbi:hypothetical protein Sliba_78190 [Streptomyces nigrescens]|uniref:Uncharacterized protein n=1 Tax=Streptomyces nigrescens TaxID=1920 RepID=A0A640TZK3_STRNI|nr:hypothetical protein Sliba_78190 [Streptomyces libani subsp. libani]GGV96339.1 hypothetical protein GCM10010500_38880 [Streptomyces libani subsp. libani]
MHPSLSIRIIETLRNVQAEVAIEHHGIHLFHSIYPYQSPDIYPYESTDLAPLSTTPGKTAAHPEGLILRTMRRSDAGGGALRDDPNDTAGHGHPAERPRSGRATSLRPFPLARPPSRARGRCRAVDGYARGRRALTTVPGGEQARETGAGG